MDAPARLAPAQTPFLRILHDFSSNPLALAGAGLLLLLVAAALLAPFISPQNPYDLAQLDVMSSRLAPGALNPAGGTFWLGTDDQGRDMLSAILYGLRISITVGVSSTILASAWPSARSARCWPCCSAWRWACSLLTWAGAPTC